MMQLSIKFIDDFHDGNVLPFPVKRGVEMTVTEETYNKIKNSGCEVEVLGKIIPRMKPAPKKATKSGGTNAKE